MKRRIEATEEQREIKRKKRAIEYAEKNGKIKNACRRFGTARSTFYLWRDRYRESGDEGLKSRRFGCHHNHPQKAPGEVVENILYLRRTYHMGPIRIVWYLQRYQFSAPWSTVDHHRARQISNARHTPHMTRPNDQ